MILKLERTIDIDLLKSYLDFVKSTCPPYMKKNGPWGGWSITSSNGEIYDGWQTGERAYAETTSPEEKKKLLEFFEQNSFDKPTSLYTPFMDELLGSLNELVPQIKLTRLRLALLRPHPETESYWHKDGDNIKTFRLHIPIVTNKDCFIEYEDERHHLEAGSIYLVNVGKKHRALNLSQEDRYHFIADVFQNP